MPRISVETRRIIHLKAIQKRLSEEDADISLSALYRLPKEELYGSVIDWPRLCMRKKLNSEQV